MVTVRVRLLAVAGMVPAVMAAGLLSPSPAVADPAGACHPEGLAGAAAGATASLRIETRKLEQVKATSTMVVRVPQTWPLSPALRQDPASEPFRRAVRCLLSYEAYDVRYTESRDTALPSVSVRDGVVSLTDVAYGDMTYSARQFRIGAWTVDTGSVPWRVDLRRSAALTKADWHEVRVEAPPGWLVGVFPWPLAEADERRVTWRGPPPGAAVGVLVSPDARIRSVHVAQKEPWRWLSDASVWFWDAVLLAALWWALVRLRRPRVTRGARRVVLVVVLIPVLFMFDALWDDHIGAGADQMSWGFAHYVETVGWVGAALAGAWVVGLPAAVWWMFAVTLTVVSGLLPLASDPDGAAEDGFRWLARLAGGFTLTWLTCLSLCFGMVAAVRGRRPARRVRLREFASSRSGRWSAGAGAAVAVLILFQRWIDSGADFRRTHWVQFPADPVLRGFGEDLATYAYSLAGDGWDFAYYLTAVALVPVLSGLLRSGDLVLPRGVRAVCCFGYALVVLPIGDFWAGWWFPLGLTVGLIVMAVLTGAAGRRNDALWVALRDVAQPVVVQEAERWRTVESRAAARERALLAGDGTSGGDDVASSPRRAWSARRLLRRWPARTVVRQPADARLALPSGVTPIDALFALGPLRPSFGNGRLGARAAFVFGVPASVWLLWADWGASPWLRPNDQFMLVSGLLGGVVAQLLYWAAQGFTLGVLWRRLPGRRGPAKALALTAVNVAAFGAEAALNKLIGEPVDRLFLLRCVLVFAVLSLTAITMDLRSVRQLGSVGLRPVRMLLVGYRLGDATAQATFALAQLAAVLAIYSFLRNGGDAPPFPGIDPFSISQRSGP